ncbi:MAG: universal stress protein [Deltaproteobacteria bacterium HGW-Deltaproteobacteria-13]|jgi:nucleotide-binding universal stress UspA family protein|nr:MAG: universal stress protein [Deltaproteobacteria bacterium HGW-Deltaproteobacteria-13]
MKEINRILVVSWMTQSCKKTIRFGVSLAEKYQAELSVIHIVNTFWLQGWSVPMISLIEERKKDLNRVKAELDNVINSEKKKGMTIKEFIKEGDPVDEILKTIKDEKIDLVILRAQEEGRVEHFLISGSNEAIIRKIPCSIFLVKDEPR